MSAGKLVSEQRAAAPWNVSQQVRRERRHRKFLAGSHAVGAIYEIGHGRFPARIVRLCLRSLSTIDNQHVTRHKIGSVGGKKYGGALQILVAAETAERNRF